MDLMEAFMKTIVAAMLCSLLACASAEPQQRTGVPETTREAAGMSTDAGARSANEPGGSSLRTADSGTDLLGPDAGDGGADR
jgi:type IV pilus biogenesis protein CpaD/CtpE